MSVSWQYRMFQFTRPRGARRSRRIACSSSLGFNSRAHGGRDGAVGDMCDRSCVSIHAPTGGATYLTVLVVMMWFQFTRPRGARPAASHAPHALARFNSRAHVGRDVLVGADAWQADVARPFQFTRPRGARPRPSRQNPPPPRFNSRAHGGRDTNLVLGYDSGDGFNSRAHGGRDIG